MDLKWWIKIYNKLNEPGRARNNQFETPLDYTLDCMHLRVRKYHKRTLSDVDCENRPHLDEFPLDMHIKEKQFYRMLGMWMENWQYVRIRFGFHCSCFFFKTNKNISLCTRQAQKVPHNYRLRIISHSSYGKRYSPCWRHYSDWNVEHQ